ncbi:acyltransferase family protein [Comamonas sp. J-3]|uniref:acyltransferase family protein n=1 Tax=Comamonas trifloxystrobinivorans TaxID=3350256 RepID=UPI00372A4F98
MGNENHSKSRDFRIDNMKVALMCLVVLGHLLEYRLDNKGLYFLYVLVYLFHMPAFAFLAGCVTRYHGESSYWTKTVSDVVIPYLLFNTAYSLVGFHAAGKMGTIQYATPYWLMWFLLALLLWRLVLPIWSQVRWAFPVALLLGLAAAFSKEVGYYLSLSRALAFFPFFLLGSLLANRDLFPHVPKAVVAIVSVVILLVTAYYLQGMNRLVIYRSVALISLGLGTLQAVFVYTALTIAALAGIALLQLVPSRNIRGITSLAVGIIGAYLIHGMLVRFVLPSLLSRAVVPSDWVFLATSTVVAAAIVVVCSHLAIKLPYLFNFRWLSAWLFVGSAERKPGKSNRSE